MTSLRETLLPNGARVFCLREDNAPAVYEQVQAYFKHGITLQPGATVFDVGANIGLFALAAYERCDQDVTVYSFEPIPHTFAALKANAARCDEERLNVFRYGLSSTRGNAIFAYHPNMPTLSTAYPEDDDELREQLRQAILRNLDSTPRHLRWLRWLPPFARTRLLDKALDGMFEVEQVSCELRTTSEVIREHGVERINLLKVDVEKSELEVLLGIEAAHWPMIMQVVMEVHDLDDRVRTIETLLRSHGLDEITVEQEPVLAGSNVFALYARRTRSP